MGVVKKILLGSVIVLVLVAIAGGYFAYAQTKSPTRAAFLAVESGSVEVNLGNGWVSAEDGISLALDDKVRTLDGLASVVLFESVIVSLDENTELSISSLVKDHPKIRLESGEVWNKFTGLLGVTNFDIETPTTVATVRGTEYGVSFADEVATVLVAEGVVGVLSEGEDVEVRKYEIVRKILGQSMLVETLTPEELARLKEKRGRIVDSLRRVRSDEIDKNQAVLRMAKRQGVTRADIDAKLMDLDEGRDDQNRLLGYVPVETESVTKVIGLNNVIRELVSELEQE